MRSRRREALSLSHREAFRRAHLKSLVADLTRTRALKHAGQLGAAALRVTVIQRDHLDTNASSTTRTVKAERRRSSRSTVRADRVVRRLEA